MSIILARGCCSAHRSRALQWMSRRHQSTEPPTPTTSFTSSLWAKYCGLLESRPLLTKSVTSCVLSLSADIICQVITQIDLQVQQQKSPNSQESITGDVVIDWKRVAKFGFLGGALVGPTLHHWYGFLARRIPGSSLNASIKRLALDQLIFAPVFIPIFLSSSLLLEGQQHKIVNKLKNEWLSTVLANFIVWVPAQFLNFKMVKPSFQVLFSNAVGVGWNIYLSHAAHKAQPVVKERPSE